jgi:hypothetical protein
MRAFPQNHQIGIALARAVMNRIRRQNGGYMRTGADLRRVPNVTYGPGTLLRHRR